MLQLRYHEIEKGVYIPEGRMFWLLWKASLQKHTSVFPFCRYQYVSFTLNAILIGFVAHIMQQLGF